MTNIGQSWIINRKVQLWSCSSPRNTLTLRVSVRLSAFSLHCAFTYMESQWPGYSKVDSVKQVPIRSPAARVDIAMIVLEQYSRLFEVSSWRVVARDRV